MDGCFGLQRYFLLAPRNFAKLLVSATVCNFLVIGHFVPRAAVRPTVEADVQPERHRRFNGSDSPALAKFSAEAVNLFPARLTAGNAHLRDTLRAEHSVPS